MKLSTLEYFVTVATELSFTKAAEKLYISQPTLSRRIRELEEEIGAILFKRQSYAITLTASGEKFLEKVVEILEQVNELGNMFVQKQSLQINEPPITLKIGYLADFKIANLLSGLQAFKEKHPQIEFELKKDTPMNLTRGLTNKKYDLIINLGTYVDQTSYHTGLFAKNNLKLVMSKKHPLAQKNKVTFSDLKEETFILLERQKSPVVVDYVTSQGMLNGFNLNVSNYAKNLDEGLTLVSLGRGISFIYSAMDDGNLEEKYGLKFIELDAPNNNQDFLVVLDDKVMFGQELLEQLSIL